MDQYCKIEKTRKKERNLYGKKQVGFSKTSETQAVQQSLERNRKADLLLGRDRAGDGEGGIVRDGSVFRQNVSF